MKEAASKGKIAKELQWTREALNEEKGQSVSLATGLAASTGEIEQLMQELNAALARANMVPALKSKIEEQVKAMERETQVKKKISNELQFTRQSLLEKMGAAESYKLEYAAAARETEELNERLAVALMQAASVPELKKKITELMQSLSDQKSSKQKMSKEMTWTRMTLADKTAEADRLKAKTAQLEEELLVSVKEANLVPELKAKLENVLEGLSRERNIKKKVGSELAHTRKALIEKAGDAEALKSELAAVTRRTHDLEQELDSALHEAGMIPSMKQKVTTILEKLAKESATKQKVGRELDHVRRELSYTMGEVSAAMGLATSLRETKEELQEMLTSAINTANLVPQLKEKINNLLATILKEKQVKFKVSTELAWARESLIAKAAEADVFKVQLAQSTRAVEDLESQFLEMSAEVKKVPALGKKLSQVQEALNRETAAKRKVAAELMHTRAGLIAKTGEANDLKAANVQLEEQVGSLLQQTKLAAKDQSKIKNLMMDLAKEADRKRKVSNELLYTRQALVSKAGDADVLKSELAGKISAVQALEAELTTTAAQAILVPGLKAKVSEYIKALKKEGDVKKKVGRELNYTRAELAAKSGENAALKASLVAAEEQVLELLKKTTVSDQDQKKIKQLMADLAKETERKLKVSSELVYTRQQLINKSGDADTYKSELSEMASNVAAMEAQLLEATTQAGLVPGLKTKMEEYVKALKKEADVKKKVGKELSYTRSELAEAKGENNTLKAELAAALSQVNLFMEKSKVADPDQRKIKSLMEDLARESDRKTKISNELLYTRKALVGKSGDADTYKAELAEMTRKVEGLETQLLENVNQAALVPGLKAKVEEYIKALKKESDVKQKVGKELNYTRAELSLSKGENNSLKTELAAMSSQVDMLMEKTKMAGQEQKKIKSLMEDLARESDRKTKVSNELLYTRKALVGKSGDADTYKAELAEMTSKVDALEAELLEKADNAALVPGLKAKVEVFVKALKKESDVKQKVGKELNYTRAELSQSKGENNSLKTELAAMSSQMVELVDRAQMAEKDQKRVKQLVEDLMRETDRKVKVSKELLYTRQSLVSKSGDADTYKAELAEMTSKVDHLEAELLAQASQAKLVPGLKAKVEEFVKALKKESDVKQKVGKELTFTRAELGAAKGENNELKSLVASLEIQVGDLLETTKTAEHDQKKIKQLMADLVKESDRKVKVASELLYTRQALVTKSGDADTFKAELAEATKQVEALEAELMEKAAQAKQVPGLKAKVADFLKTLQREADTKRKVGKELSYTRGELAARTGENAELKAGLAATQAELLAAVEQANLVPEMRSKITSLVTSLEKETSVKSKISRELTYMRESVVVKAGEADSLRFELSDTHRTVQSLEQQLDVAMEDVKLVPTLRKKITTLTEALTRETNSKLKTAKELNYTREELAVRTTEANKLKGEVAELQQQLVDLESAVDERNTVIAGMEQQLAILKKEIEMKRRSRLAELQAMNGSAAVGDLVPVMRVLEEKEREAVELHTKLEESISQVTALEDQVVALQEELEVKTQLFCSQLKTLASNAVTASMEGATTASATELLKVQASLIDTDTRTEFENQLRKLREESNAANLARRAAEQKTELLEKELAEERSEVLALRSNVQKTVETTVELQGEVKRLQEELALAQQQNLASAAAAVVEPRGNGATHESADMNELRLELQSERKTAQTLKEELTKVDKALAQAKEGLKVEMEHVNVLESRLKSSRGETSALRNQVLDLGRSLRAAEAKLEHLSGVVQQEKRA